jgi:hypothetical protein
MISNGGTLGQSFLSTVKGTAAGYILAAEAYMLPTETSQRQRPPIYPKTFPLNGQKEESGDYVDQTNSETNSETFSTTAKLPCAPVQSSDQCSATPLPGIIRMKLISPGEHGNTKSTCKGSGRNIQQGPTIQYNTNKFD